MAEAAWCCGVLPLPPPTTTAAAEAAEAALTAAAEAAAAEAAAATLGGHHPPPPRPLYRHRQDPVNEAEIRHCMPSEIE
jgi:hypothetical protein